MIRVPGDKSISHRALLLGAVADGVSRLQGVLPGEDCRSTAVILRQLGVEVPPLPPAGGAFELPGVGLRGLAPSAGTLDCGNSGTTARLLLGLLAGLSTEAVLTGDASLRRRPMARVTGPLALAGARFQEEGEPGRLPVRVAKGELGPIRHRTTVASAQVKSALLLAGVAGGVAVEVVEPALSRDHSERMLRRMGADVLEEGTSPHTVRLPAPPERLAPMELRVPGDVSSAAFFLVLGVLGGAGPEGLALENVGLNPTRTGFLEVLHRMGARVHKTNVREETDPAGEPAGDLSVGPMALRGVEIGGPSIATLIDEIPILAVAAARARGTTVVRDAAELRVKESDRIRVLVRNLTEVGVEAKELPDGLVIHGTDAPLDGTVETHGDHRVAMAFGVLGALPGCRVQIDDPDVAAVSFPGFWPLLQQVTEGRQ